MGNSQTSSVTPVRGRQLTVKPRLSVVEDLDEPKSITVIVEKPRTTDDAFGTSTLPNGEEQKYTTALDDRTSDERVRALLRQIAIGHIHWSELTKNDEFDRLTSTINCSFFCKSYRGKRKKRNFHESLDDDLLCTLHYAVLHNNLEVCRKLLSPTNPKSSICYVDIRGVNKETALHMYARRFPWDGNKKEDDPGPQILELLLMHRATINAYDNEFQTPLHHAVKRDDLSYAEWLVNHGATVEVYNNTKETPLHFACCLSSDDHMHQFIRLLLGGLNERSDSNALRDYINRTDANGKSALCLAAEHGGIEAIKLLMKHSTPDAISRSLAIQCAIKSNRTEVLETLIGPSNTKWSKVKSLLHLVIAQSNNRLIPSSGAAKTEEDLDKITPYIIATCDFPDENYDENGFTPLLLAAKCGYFRCFTLLLEKSTDKIKLLGEKTKDVHYRKLNIIHLCAEQQKQSKNTDMVEFVYNSKQKTIKVKDEDVPLPILDGNDGHIDICKHLFNKNLNLPDYFLQSLLYDEDDEGNTPLHLACEQSYGAMCQLLVDKMEELSKSNRYLMVQDLKKRTPLHECAQNGELKLVEILLSPKTNRNTHKQNKDLLDTTRDSNGRTPLHLACVKGHLNVVKYFYEKFSASVTTTTDKRDTPLFSACEYGHLDIVQYLLQHTDADATVRNWKGLNALDVAITRRNESVVECLLDCSNWRRLMSNAHYDDNNIPSTPMRKLIIYMPEIAYKLLTTKLTKVTGGDDQTMHRVTYDYTFIDDQSHLKQWMYGTEYDKRGLSRTDLVYYTVREWWEGPDSNDPDRIYPSDNYVLIRNHPLILMGQCKDEKLMDLDYCTALRSTKLRQFGLWFFALFFLSFTVFLVLYTVVILITKDPSYYYKLYNASLVGTNQTFQWEFGFNLTLCYDVGAFVTTNSTEAYKTADHKRIKYVLYVLLFLFIFKNLILVVAACPHIFRKKAYYVEALALILDFVFLYDWYDWQNPLNFRCPIQWQVGATGLLLTWLNLLTYLRYVTWNNIGLYVVMLQVILAKFIKFIPVLFVLFCGFGFTYYALLQYETVYGTPFEALMRTSLSLFDLGYESRMYSGDDRLMLYGMIYAVFFLTEVVMMILITNLLIGLAVGEIPTLKTQAKMHRNLIYYELLSDYEYFHLQLKMFWCGFKWQWRRICVCCGRKSIEIDAQQAAHRTHSRHYLNENRHPDNMAWYTRWFTYLKRTCGEEPIQSDIDRAKMLNKKDTLAALDQDDE